MVDALKLPKILLNGLKKFCSIILKWKIKANILRQKDKAGLASRPTVQGDQRLSTPYEWQPGDRR
jgi:hypothetical protein